MVVGGQPHAPAASTSGKDPVPIVQEASCRSKISIIRRITNDDK